MWWTKTVWERLAAGVALARLRRHPLPLQTQQSQTLAEAPAALAGRSGWIIEIVYDTLCHTLHPGRKSPHERQGFYCSLNWLQVPVDAAERDSMRPQGTPSQLAVRPSRRRHVAGSRRERLSRTRSQGLFLYISQSAAGLCRYLDERLCQRCPSFPRQFFAGLVP